MYVDVLDMKPPSSVKNVLTFARRSISMQTIEWHYGHSLLDGNSRFLYHLSYSSVADEGMWLWHEDFVPGQFVFPQTSVPLHF